MVADELRRQADDFVDLASLQKVIGRDPAERAERGERPPRHGGPDRRSAPAQHAATAEDYE